MKIRGVYILTLRNIKRMIAVLAAAFFASCTSATSPENIAIAGRISNATLTLKVLECSALASGAACVVVPDIQYVECKALYLDMRKAAAHATPALPAAATRTSAPARLPATKADLRAAVKTILRGEDVNLSKPGPRPTRAKRQQIAAAEQYRKTHCGCTLHNACLRSFVAIPGGYASGKSLYRVMKRMNC